MAWFNLISYYNKCVMIETKLKITENLEDYLYEIYEILKEAPVARIKDLAKRRNVKLSSAVMAARNLADKGLINYQKYEYITLTEEGLKLAKKLENRKKVLYKFLTEVLKIDPEIAKKDVHKMEHDLSEETINKIIDFTEQFLEQN